MADKEKEQSQFLIATAGAGIHHARSQRSARSNRLPKVHPECTFLTVKTAVVKSRQWYKPGLFFLNLFKKENPLKESLCGIFKMYRFLGSL